MPCGEYFTGYDERMGLVRWRIEWVALLLGIPIPFLLPFVLDSLPLLSLSFLLGMFITAIAVLGLNIMVGYAGQLVLAQGAFMAIGAYTVANLLGSGVGLLPAVLVGGLLAGVLSVIAGLPSYRVKGYYIGITTLALQFIVEWALDNRDLAWLTGGSRQTLDVQSGLVGGQLQTQSGELSFYYVVLVLLIVAAVVSLNLTRTSTGRFFRSIRENDLAAELLGVRVYRMKLLAFLLGGFFVGVAGGLWVFHIGVADPSHYDVFVTLDHYVILLFGGIARVWGVLLGAGSVLTIEQALFHWVVPVVELTGVAVNPGGIRNILFGVIIIAVLILEPRGLIAWLGRLKQYLRRWPYAY